MANQGSAEPQRDLKQERWELLDHINTLTDKPMVALSFVWLLLIIVGFTHGLSRTLQIISDIIWALFVLDFVLEIIIAPHRRAYLRAHWLTAISLLIPALRMLRILQAIRLLRVLLATRPLDLVRVVGSLNRGMGAVARTVGRRGVAYVAAVTVIVTFVGAAGMYAFESPAALRASGLSQAAANGAGLHSYGEAVWWTAMIMTTMGSEYWPKTPEGRILTWLLAVYAFAVFGYLTATIASYFIGQDTASAAATGDAGSQPDMAALQSEIAALRQDMASLLARLDASPATDARRPVERRPPT